MSKVSTVIGCAVLGLAVLPALADPVPYSNIGVAAPNVPLTAASTGAITAYFAGASTAGNDLIRLFNVSQGTFSTWTLSSGTSTLGQSFNLGTANQGDVLVFQLINYALMNPATGTYPILASDPTYSDDKLNHTYVTGYSGAGSIPAGTYLAFEDYLGGYDFDYNDDTFVVTNLSTSAVAPTPEPGSLLLLGTGLLTGFGLLRHRVRKG